MYDLVDALTFDMRRITPEMWNVFELTYKLFKTDAIDFLEGMLWYFCKSNYYVNQGKSRNASIT